jgi:WD40 repeat protein
MNTQLPLTEDAIRAAVLRRAMSGSEGNLRERVLEATAVVPQARGWRVRWGQGLAMPERRTSLVLAIVLLMLLAAGIAAAVVGSLVHDTAPAPLGGLAYISGGDLYVAGPLGEDARLVWDVPATEDQAPLEVAWIDRENVLLQTYAAEGGGVHVVNVNTGANRILDAGSFVALSPDRRRVAISTVDDTPAQAALVRLIDVETGAPVGEIQGEIRGYPAAWSPDGRSILGELPDAIERVDVATGERTILASGLCCGLSPHWPRWSSDGLRVVYVAYHEPSREISPLECEFRCGTVWVVAAAGGEPSRITAELGSEILPSFSPDGRWIAYIDQCPGSYAKLTVLATDGSGARVLAQDPRLPPIIEPAGGEIIPGCPSGPYSWDPDSAGLTYVTSAATLWHVPLEGPPIRIQAPAVSEFARQVLP